MQNESTHANTKIQPARERRQFANPKPTPTRTQHAYTTRGKGEAGKGCRANDERVGLVDLGSSSHHFLQLDRGCLTEVV